MILSFNITSHWVICGNLLWNGARMGQECLWYWMGEILLFNTMSHIYQASNYTLPLQIRMLSQGITFTCKDLYYGMLNQGISFTCANLHIDE